MHPHPHHVESVGKLLNLAAQEPSYVACIRSHGVLIVGSGVGPNDEPEIEARGQGKCRWWIANETVRMRTISLSAEILQNRVKWAPGETRQDGNRLEHIFRVDGIESHTQEFYPSISATARFDVLSTGDETVRTSAVVWGRDQERHGNITIRAIFTSLVRRTSRIGPEKEIRICHISDLHFGGQHDRLVYEEVNDTFSRTDHFLGYLRTEVADRKHFDLLVISGDVTSVAAHDEFTEFVTFLERVQATHALRGESFWDRVVLVPGNHELTRLPGTGGADRLERFSQFVQSSASTGRPMATPYSVKNSQSCINSGFNIDNVPFALHRFEDLNIDVLTLVSCQYGQQIDPRVLDLMAAFERLKETKGSAADGDEIRRYFSERLRLDRGFFPPEYVSYVPAEVSKYPSPKAGSKPWLRIAVAHHNATKYFEQKGVQETGNGQVLLAGLVKQHFSAYLHGHIHWAPAPGVNGLVQVPCASLGGHPSAGNHGFNVLRWVRARRGPFFVECYELREGRFEAISTSRHDLV